MRNKYNRRNGEQLGLMKLAMLLLLAIVIVAGAIYFFEITPEQLDSAAEQLISTTSPNPTAQGIVPTATPLSTQSEPNSQAVLPVKGKLSVVFLEVGNADCTFVQSPNGKTMLIDSGESGAFYTIDDFLKRCGISKIDVLVATHPHNDHIGSMERIIENYAIDKIYMPKVAHNTPTYENLLTAITEKGMKIKDASGGMNSVIPFDDNVSVRILSPLDDEYSRLNDYSVVLRLDYNNSSFLLTGDIESDAECDIVSKYSELLRADVLKVPHHGSSSSSTEEFLSAVDPDYAIISCDIDSDYNHPSAEVIDKLNVVGAEQYRTDLFGTIAVITDGYGFEIKTEYYGE